MADAQTDTVIRYIRSLATAQKTNEQIDGDLLDAFLSHNDQLAFEVLVRRHGPMVLRVCRRVLGNGHDAEDALQATFLVLAQKAKSIRKKTTLASWLHGVAYRMATHANRARSRRRTHESEVQPATSQDPALNVALRELQTILDEEIERLPDSLRETFVYIYLENRSCVEVARQLGLNESAVRMRLNRARKRLRERLTGRGVSLMAALAAVAVGADAAPAALSRSLVCAIVKAAAQIAVGQSPAGGLVSAKVLSLMEGMNRTMTLMKWKAVVLLLATLPVAAIGLGVTTYANICLPGGTSPEFPAVAGADDFSQLPQLPQKKPSRSSVASAVSADRDRTGAQRERAKELLQQALELLGVANGDASVAPSRALLDIAIQQINLGERAAAADTFRRARRAIDGLPEEGRLMELRLLAHAYAQAGDTQAVLDIVNKDIPERPANFVGSAADFREMLLTEGAKILAQEGHERDALRLAEAIQKEDAQALARRQVRVELTLSQIRAHHFPAARRLIAAMDNPEDRVTALAGVIYANPTYSQFPARPGLALALATAGRKDDARQALAQAGRSAEKMSESPQKQRALAAIVCAQSRLGETELARQLLKSIADEAWLNIAAAALVEELGAVGKDKEALPLIERLPKEAMKVHAFYHLAGGQVRAKKRKESVESFAKAVQKAVALAEEEQSMQFHNIATAQAAAGDFKGAEQTLRDHLHNAPVARANMAHELAIAGKTDEALQLAEEMPETDWWRANIVRDVARQQATSGHEQEALIWIDKLPSPLLRGNALLGLAEGLVGRK